MRIGQIFRYPSKPSTEVEIDGLPNWYAETKPPNDRGWSAVKLDSGINCSAILNGLQNVVPYIAISSSPHRFGSDTTPWEDIHRPDQGYCRYFGDNKPGTGAASESLGNRRMIEAFNLQGGDRQDREQAPPILVFEAVPMDGRLKGQRIFHGFGLISRAELVVQRSPASNKTFSNYVFDIALLNLEYEDDEFPWRWINSRRDPLVGSDESFDIAPESWKNWVRKGKESVPTLRRNVITRNVVSVAMQRPASGTEDLEILNGIYSYFSGRNHKFEVLAEFVTQQIFGDQGLRYSPGWITKGSSDGGFDFVGSLDLDPQGVLKSGRQIILGQAKCEKLDKPTNGLHIARLAARLQRGWVGVYVTTSYFSIPVQKEVLADRYPILLVDGGRLASVVRKHLMNQGIHLSTLLDQLTSTYETRISYRDPETVLDVS
jgi:hypothetical protein